MDSAVSPNPARQSVHIPKLKYRQSTYDVHSAETASIVSSKQSVPTIATSSAPPSEFCPSPRYPPSDISADPSSRRPSVASSFLAPPRTPDKKAKKKSFFSSLFAKEPSAQALADFEKHLKTQGTLKNGRITAVGMPGISSAKLPSTVPKVNSKWDGVPLSAKEIEKKELQASQPRLSMFGNRSSSDQSVNSNSTTSLRTAARRPSSKGTLSGASVYTTRSDGNRNQLAELYGWELAEYSENLEGTSSRPSTKGASIRSMPTPLTQSIATEPMHPPKIPQAYFDSAPAPTSTSHSGSLSPNPPTHSYSPTLTPRDESPETPNEPSPSPLTNLSSTESDARSHKVLKPPHDHIRTTVVEAPDSIDEVIIQSSGINVLPLPSVGKKRPKTPTESDGAFHTVTGSTLKEPKSILKKESAPSSHTISQQRPALDTLYTKTSVMDLTHQSPQWKAKLPFGFHESPGKGVDQTSERTTTPTPESGTLLQRRKSRLGIFRKEETTTT